MRMHKNDLPDRVTQLTDAFDAIQDGIVIMDREVRIVWVNAWIRTHYPEHAPFVGRSFPGTFASITGSTFEPPCVRAIATGEPQSFVRAYADPTGAERWLEVRIHRVKGSGDGCAGAIAHFTDITERRRIEEEREAEAARRRVLVEHSRDGIAVVNLSGEVVEANEEYARQLGYTLDEVYGLHIWDWNVDYPAEELLESLRAAEPYQYRFETRHRRKDGSFVDVEVTTSHDEIGGEKLVFSICRDITERKRLERRQRLSQHSVDRANAQIFWLDRDGRVRYASEAACESLGYTREEMLQMSIGDIDLAAPATWEDDWRTLVEQGEVAFETSHYTKDRVAIPVEVSASYVDFEGEEYSFVFARDITERKELEQRLEDEIAWRRMLVWQSRDGIVVLNRAGGVVEANEEFARQIGYSLEECQNLHIWEWNPDVPKDVLLQMIAEVGVAGETVETTHTRKDGSTYEVEISSQGSEIAGEKYVLAICRDVSERNRLERLLEAEIAWRRILFGESRDGIVVMDRNGAVVEANEQFARRLGYAPDEVQRLHIWDWAVDDGSREELVNRIRAIPPGGELFETRHRRKDGGVFDVEISSNGAEIEGQRYVLAVCRDVSERKRAEAERERLIGELQEALAEIRTLRGILPVCSYCHKVRDDEGYWHRVDVYIRDHSEADVSHGICPDCLKKYYGDLSLKED